MTEEGRKVIEKIREEKIKEMLRTGEYYIVTRENIPMFQATKEGVIASLKIVKEEAPKYGTTAEIVYSGILVHDLLHGKKYTVTEFMSLPEEKSEVPETKIPEGVEVVKYTFAVEKDAEVAETMFDAIMTGKYMFRSAVNIGTMVRCVMYEKGEKVGTPVRMVVVDKDMAWHLQQLIDWCLRDNAKILATRREGKVVEVAFRMEGVRPAPPKEKLFFSFKKTDGWSLVGEEK